MKRPTCHEYLRQTYFTPVLLYLARRCVAADALCELSFIASIVNTSAHKQLTVRTLARGDLRAQQSFPFSIRQRQAMEA